jgi:hypothetical protein
MPSIISAPGAVPYDHGLSLGHPFREYSFRCKRMLFDSI